jgi:hypothetical protein
MSYVIAAPEMMTAAATDLATIGSNVSAAHAAAAARTVAVLPAAADEVSAGIAQLFSQHAANYQALGGQAAAFNGQFVQHLTAGAFSYASIEAAITSFLQDVNGNVNGWANQLVHMTPQDLLDNIGLVFSLPVLIPAFIVVFLPVYYFLVYLPAHGLPIG